VDSSSGTGIQELKRSIVEHATTESRVRVPGWYSRVEAKLKEMSKATAHQLKRFSIGREEFEKKSLLPPRSSNSLN
jgi:Fe2+ transport system protein B